MVYTWIITCIRMKYIDPRIPQKVDRGALLLYKYTEEVRSKGPQSSFLSLAWKKHHRQLQRAAVFSLSRIALSLFCHCKKWPSAINSVKQIFPYLFARTLNVYPFEGECRTHTRARARCRRAEMSIPWVVMRQRRKESRRSLTEQKKTTIIISGFKKEK